MNLSKSLFSFFAVIYLCVMQSACTGLPENINAVKLFKLTDYLGDWYEIARLDHSFERGLSHISANYSMREDGGVKVINRGYSIENQAWKTADGKAYFVGDPSLGHLKVSFFGPFYGSYVVFYLDNDYQQAYVTSYNKDYLWFLARTPDVPQAEKDRFIQEAAKNGFDVSQLIWVDHGNSDNLPKDSRQ